MQWFVKKDSIVREIWGKSDTILFVFAGSAAEFALNKAVDWLFFTGRLPADPLGRLFSTVTYARDIIFSSVDDANSVIDRMASIHEGVEQKRGARIPPWAYRDVLYMLIDYSIRSYELLNRPLLEGEKEEVFNVFTRVGNRMGIPDLPTTFSSWKTDRDAHLHADLQAGELTIKLFMQYRKHLGLIRYHILLAAQALIMPPRVRELLKSRKRWWAMSAIKAYKATAALKLDWYVKLLVLPKKYLPEIKRLETA
jgi:uncharacterized protein (DUF2236 family)